MEELMEESGNGSSHAPYTCNPSYLRAVRFSSGVKLRNTHSLIGNQERGRR